MKLNIFCIPLVHLYYELIASFLALTHRYSRVIMVFQDLATIFFFLSSKHRDMGLTFIESTFPEDSKALIRIKPKSC